MKVRGRRECQNCGTVWTYYETGSPSCPECGSLHSVGLDERTRHTDTPTMLDLTPVRNAIDEVTREEIADRAVETAREYVRKRGFIDAGELRPLDDTYVAATELVYVARAYGRATHPSDDEALYFIDLLGTADEDAGAPRGPDTVPERFRSPYCLAMAAAVGDFQTDVRTYLRDEPDREAARLSGRIRDHRKRVEALDGDVDPAEARRLVSAARDLGKYLSRDDESALVTADNWLAGLEPGA